MDPETHPRPLHDVSLIETPEQIELRLPLAGIGTRSAAYMLDFLLQTVPMIALFALLLMFFTPLVDTAKWKLNEEAPLASSWVLMVLALWSFVLFSVNFGYFAFFEVFWKGQSPGKRVLRIRVVRDGGHPIDGRSALIRNTLRVVDSLPFAYLLGIITIFVGRHGKRVGDYAAGTLVIAERKVTFEKATNDSFSKKDPEIVRLAREFMERRDALPPSARNEVSKELARQLAIRLGRPRPEDSEAFIEEVLRQ